MAVVSNAAARAAGRSGAVHDLQLDPIRVVEEDRVVARRIGVFARLALDHGAPLAQPTEALVHDVARAGVEADVMNATP